MKYIGIDTGVNTGFAVWDTKTQTFECVDCVKIHEAMHRVAHLAKTNDVEVRFEDARQRRWIPDTHNIRREMGRRQGAGSVKRDSGIWQDFLQDIGVSFTMRAPRYNCTKLSAEAFRSLTKWQKRTNEHGRDAAMLVFGETDTRLK